MTIIFGTYEAHVVITPKKSIYVEIKHTDSIPYQKEAFEQFWDDVISF